jgi:hypothetical protein
MREGFSLENYWVVFGLLCSVILVDTQGLVKLASHARVLDRLVVSGFCALARVLYFEEMGVEISL